MYEIADVYGFICIPILNNVSHTYASIPQCPPSFPDHILSMLLSGSEAAGEP